MRAFADAVSVITGAGGGLGSELALACARRRARLLLSDKDATALQKTAALVRGKYPDTDIELFAADVRRLREVELLGEGCLTRYGRVDFAFNNAGIDIVTPVWETGEREWDLLLGVNVLGVAWGSRVFARIMQVQGSGHIINTASAAGLMSSVGQGAYCASKAAVIAMSESLALELKRIGSPIRVTVVAPAFIPTDILGKETDGTALDGLARQWRTELQGAVAGAKVGAEEVAERILRSVESGVFFAFPHQGVKRHVLARADAACSGAALYDAFSAG